MTIRISRRFCALFATLVALACFLTPVPNANAGQSVLTLDRGVAVGTAAGSGGTFIASYAIPTDKGVSFRVTALVSQATSSHLSAFAKLYIEYVVENKNGAVTAPPAFSGSSNPSVAATSVAQASDVSSLSAVSAALSSTNATFTITNNGAAPCNVTIYIEAVIVGST